VVAEAADGRSALEAVERTRPDLVTMDVEMPHVDGLTAVERLMARCPLPILVVTACPAEQRSATLFEAVARGALDLVAKPALSRGDESASLRATVRRLAVVPVVRHAGRRLRTSTTRPPAPVARGP